MTDYGLTLGAVDFCDPDGGIQVIRDGQSSWGSPTPVTAIVDSLIADGSLVKWQRDDNREASFTVGITGSDSAELAWREKALVDELYRPNLLTYVPSDGLAPPSVYTVLTSDAELALDVDQEDAGVRLYQVTLTCAPYVSSSSPTTVSSVASGAGSPVVLSAGSVATGWDSPVSSDGSILSAPVTSRTWDPPPAGGDATVGLTTWYAPATFRLTSTDFTTTPFVCVDVKTQLSFTYAGDSYVSAGPSTYTEMYVNGASAGIKPMAAYQSPDDAAYTRLVFVASNQSAVTSLRFVFVSTLAAAPGSSSAGPSAALFKNVQRAGSAPGLTTHEVMFSAPIGGSRRAPVSLHLSKITSGSVGDCVIYTGPDLGEGFRPSLRSYSTAAGTTDATAWSGVSWSGGGSGIQVPASVLRPGAYMLVARTKNISSTTPVLWTATMAGKTVTSTPVYRSVGSSWTLITLGTLVLPPKMVPGTSTLQVTIKAAYTLDDAWLLPLAEDSAITVLTGAPRHVWIDAPTLDTPAPRIYAGTQPDRSDATAAQSLAVGGWDTVTAEPGNLLTYIACAATDAAMDVTYTKQWHTHAAE